MDEKDNSEPSIIRLCRENRAWRLAQALERGEDVNTRDADGDMTCLHVALHSGALGAVDVILAHDASHHDVDYTARTKNGLLAVEMALFYRPLDLAHDIALAAARSQDWRNRSVKIEDFTRRSPHVRRDLLMKRRGLVIS